MLWLERHLTVDEDDAQYLNGQRLGGSETKAVYRWRAGGAPSFWKADELLVRHGMAVGINDYLAWAEEAGRSPWRSGEAPWFERPMTVADWWAVEREWPETLDGLVRMDAHELADFMSLAA